LLECSRTIADKRHCVRLALENFADMSDRAVAELVGVTHPFVMGLRSDLAAGGNVTTPPATRTGQDGKQYPAGTKPAAPTNDGLTHSNQAADDFAAPAMEERPHIVQATPGKNWRESKASLLAFWKSKGHRLCDVSFSHVIKAGKTRQARNFRKVHRKVLQFNASPFN
jgi:hypothetical protein